MARPGITHYYCEACRDDNARIKTWMWQTYKGARVVVDDRHRTELEGRVWTEPENATQCSRCGEAGTVAVGVPVGGDDEFYVK